MKSRVIWGVLIVAAAALLIAGAVNRTMARSQVETADAGQTGEQQRRGQAVASVATDAQAGIAGQTQSQGAGKGQSGVNGDVQGQGVGQGNGTGQGNGNGQGQISGQPVQAESDLYAGSAVTAGGHGQGSRANGAGSESLANVEGLETLQATVVEADDEHMLLFQGPEGTTLEITGRAWRFALENGLTVRQGDNLTISGFYDEEQFEPVVIVNNSSSQQVQVRETTGRPLWSGQGGRRSGT
jgi:hypothetical protein